MALISGVSRNLAGGSEPYPELALSSPESYLESTRHLV